VEADARRVRVRGAAPPGAQRREARVGTRGEPVRARVDVERGELARA
jgi:hypothetical protein